MCFRIYIILFLSKGTICTFLVMVYITTRTNNALCTPFTYFGKKIKSCLHRNVKVRYVDSEQSLQKVVLILKKHSMVAFDMEGSFSLNKFEGTIHLLQFATPNKNIYIIDAKKIGDEVFSFSNLGGVLCNPNIIKLCYDARCDAKMLYYQKNISIAGFYDLQIVFNFLFQDKNDPYLKGYHVALQCLLRKTTLAENVLQPSSKTAWGIEISLLQSFIQFKQNQKKKWTLDFGSTSSDQFYYSVLDVVFLFDLYLLGCEQTCFSGILNTTQCRISNFLKSIQESSDNIFLMSRVDFI